MHTYIHTHAQHTCLHTLHCIALNTLSMDFFLFLLNPHVDALFSFHPPHLCRLCHAHMYCSRTPILTNGTAAARRSFEAAPQDITSEYTTEWMEGQMETMNKLSEVYCWCHVLCCLVLSCVVCAVLCSVVLGCTTFL
jgi:hypothetical protein